MELSDTAKQVEFGQLVGISQQAVGKLVAAAVLSPGESYQAWLHAYCTKLRTEASGRQINETRVELDRAKTREAIANAKSKELALYREQKLVLDREQVKAALENWIATAKAEYLNSIDKVVAGIESRHGVTINREEEIDGIVGTACRTIGDFSFEPERADQ